MRKKGGMELSINAIVILIIAMVVLGIGILFIRGMFAKASTTTFKALSSQDTTNPASADRPLVADREVMVSPTNPTASIAISVYNIATEDKAVSVKIGNCSDTYGNNFEAGIAKAKIGFTPITGTISSSTFAGYQAVISMNKNSSDEFPYGAGDSAVCTILASLGTGTTAKNYSTSVIMKVQSSS